MDDHLEYRFQSTIYITVKGALDASSSRNFESDVEARLKQAGNTLVVIDLEHVDFINSLGLAAVVQIWKKAKALDQTIRILANEKIARIFQVSKLDTIIELYVFQSC